MSQSKIYVGNLSYDTTQEELESFFAQHGAISDTRLIIDRDTGRSKGFAFITFEDAGSAEAALTVNGTELQGRPLRVNMARDDRGGRSGGGNRGGNRDGGDRW